MINDAAMQALGSYQDYVGKRGLKRLGKKRWRHAVAGVVVKLSRALEPDYVVLGGGNAKLFDEPPAAALSANGSGSR